MSGLSRQKPPKTPPRPGPHAWRRRGRAAPLGICLISLPGLLLLLLLSLAIGSRSLPPEQVLAALRHYDRANDLHLVVRELRLPRGLLALAVGAALGISGAIMQAVTRNPLAEPGLLGVNSGAALAVVLGATIFGPGAMGVNILCAMLGAGLAGGAVFQLGRVSGGGADPVRLILAGAGLSVLLAAATGCVILNSGAEVLDSFRHWAAGALEGRDLRVVTVMLAVLLLGGGMAMALAPALNALALGSELGLSLGLNPRLVWSLSCLVVMALCGAATALAGPIGFVGLVAPHAARAIAGPENRMIVPLSALLGAAILLLADIIGRVVAAPEEIAAGIVAAVLGGPFFIQAVRRFRLVQL